MSRIVLVGLSHEPPTPSSAGHDDDRAHGVLGDALADRAEQDTGESATSPGPDDQQLSVPGLIEQHAGGMAPDRVHGHGDAAQVSVSRVEDLIDDASGQGLGFVLVVLSHLRGGFGTDIDPRDRGLEGVDHLDLAAH